MNSILIVEDEMCQREMLVDYFKQDGYQMYTASNGKEALEIIGKEELDLVVSDIQMPKMDGLELVCELSRTRSDLPVILITGYGTTNMVIEAMKNGAADFLLKPIDIKKLARTIKENIDKTLSSWKEELKPFLHGAFSYKLPVSSYHLLGVLSRRIGDMIFEYGYIEAKHRHVVKMMLYEAFSNTMFQGSLEISNGLLDDNVDDSSFMDEIQQRVQDQKHINKSIEVEAVLGKEQLNLIIRSDGYGLDWQKKLLEAEDLENLWRPYGRGLVLIKHMMGEGNYKVNGKGNILTLIFQRKDGI